MASNPTSKKTQNKQNKTNQTKTPTKQTRQKIFSKGSVFNMLRKLFSSIDIENPSGPILHLIKQAEGRQARVFLTIACNSRTPALHLSLKFIIANTETQVCVL